MLISKNNDAHVLGFTALHIAVQENDTAAVQLLLESHADTNIQNKYGITFYRYYYSKEYLVLMVL